MKPVCYPNASSVHSLEFFNLVQYLNWCSRFYIASSSITYLNLNIFSVNRHNTSLTS